MFILNLSFFPNLLTNYSNLSDFYFNFFKKENDNFIRGYLNLKSNIF